MRNRPKTILAELNAARSEYGARSAASPSKLLARLQEPKFADPDSILQFHDMLLFLRAFPQSRRVAAQAEKLLRTIEPQVRRLQASGTDMSVFDSEEFSGVVGTELRNSWTFELARWLMKRHPTKVTTGWNLAEQARRMAIVLPNIVPLLEDDSFVEPDTPFIEMMRLAADGSGRVLEWLLDSFDRLAIPPLQKTGLYDSLDIELVWNLSKSPASRTLARRPTEDLFIHHTPLLQRKDVSLLDEVRSPPLPLRKLNLSEGQEMLDFAREALAVRYRELHGTTNGEPRHVCEATAGRGVLLYLWGLTPEWRLPLRAYYAGITLKNGVPVNYFEAIGLFEWLELGFNTFYAFREGETAWIYSKIVHLLHQVSGAACFSVYPYQLGYENEEAIASGAFWFYRKLGFRPGRPDLLALTKKEEAKIARNPRHRTSAATLRRLAEGHVFFEFGKEPHGQWDTFSTRNIERRLLRNLAGFFQGDADKMRARANKHLSRVLAVNLECWSPFEQQAFTNFACVLTMVPELKNFTADEKQLLLEAIRAKNAPEETHYLRLLQRQRKLRKAFLELGGRTGFAASDVTPVGGTKKRL